MSADGAPSDGTLQADIVEGLVVSSGAGIQGGHLFPEFCPPHNTHRGGTQTVSAGARAASITSSTQVQSRQEK